MSIYALSKKNALNSITTASLGKVLWFNNNTYMYMYWLVRFTGKDDGFWWRLGSDLPWHVHLYTLTLVYPSDNVPFPSLPRQFIWIIHCSDVPYVPIFLVTLGLAFWGVGIGLTLKLVPPSSWILSGFSIP